MVAVGGRERSGGPDEAKRARRARLTVPTRPTTSLANIRWTRSRTWRTT